MQRQRITHVAQSFSLSSCCVLSKFDSNHKPQKPVRGPFLTGELLSSAPAAWVMFAAIRPRLEIGDRKAFEKGISFY